ncbi:MAG: DMT family transporter [Pyrinomonadaceae bacterium]
MTQPTSTKIETRIGPHLALIAVQALFGTWPIAGKIVLRSLSPIGLVAFRIFGAALALIGLTWLLGFKRIESRREYGQLALYSLIGVVLNQLLFVKGLAMTTVINATLISSTIPIFTLIVGVALGKEFITTRKVVGIALAAAGVIYLVNPAQADMSRDSLVGDGLLLVNSLCYGAYIALTKDLVRKYGALTVITWVFLLGNVVTLPLAVWQVAPGTIVQMSGLTWVCLAYVILFPTVTAYFLNGWALTRVDPSVVAIYIYLQPLFAFALAPLILGEWWNSRAWLAMALIFAGVFVVNRRRRLVPVAA